MLPTEILSTPVLATLLTILKLRKYIICLYELKSLCKLVLQSLTSRM